MFEQHVEYWLLLAMLTYAFSDLFHHTPRTEAPLLTSYSRGVCGNVRNGFPLRQKKINF